MFFARLFSSLILFIIIFSAGVSYTFKQTKLYKAQGLLEIHDPRPIKALSIDDFKDVSDSAGSEEDKVSTRTETEDFNTAVRVLESNTILFGVEQRLRGNSRERFMAPYSAVNSLSGPLSPVEVLESNRSVRPVPDSKTVEIHYIHPDPVIAAEVANLFMKEFIDHYLKLEIDGYMRMVEDLRIRLDQMDDQIEDIAKALNQYRKEEPDHKTKIRIQEDELETLYKFRKELYAASQESKARVNLVNPRARIVDFAYPPYEDQPYKPDVMKNLSYSFCIGLFVALIPLLWPSFRKKIG